MQITKLTKIETLFLHQTLQNCIKMYFFLNFEVFLLEWT